MSSKEHDAYLEIPYPHDREGNYSHYAFESVLGSLAEERRTNRSKNFKLYNSKVRKARKLTKPLTLAFLSQDFVRFAESEGPFNNLETRCTDFNMKLSLLEARYPSTTFELRVNVQELTKSDMRLLRSFVIWYYLSEIPDWVRFYVEESLDSILKLGKVPTGGKTFREVYTIRSIFLNLGRDQGFELLRGIYRMDNLKKWYKTGKNLSSTYQIVKIPYARVKEKIRRRGYHETSSNIPYKVRESRDWNKKGHPLKAKGDPIMVKKSEVYKELEETKQRILLKQAKLFEKRLDDYLQLADPELDPSTKRAVYENLIRSNTYEDKEKLTIENYHELKKKLED